MPKKSKAQETEEARQASLGIESLEDHTARLKEEMREYNATIQRRSGSAMGEAGLEASSTGGSTTSPAPASGGAGGT